MTQAVKHFIWKTEFSFTNHIKAWLLADLLNQELSEPESDKVK